MTTTDKCAKCGGETIEGFIFDRGHYNAKTQQVWVEGIPEESIWTGIKTSGRAAFNVQAYRCNDCNFLEFYTTEEVDLSGFFN